MIIAYNDKKERVHIDNAVRGNEYFCPTCGDKLCIKRGNIKCHHYSHLSVSTCDGWHYDMSEWHNSWQNQFPIENQEVVFELDGKKHRADVFINNTIIEFQHSKISNAEFNERNDFYNSLGYKVIWIFDAIEDFTNNNIHICFEKNNFLWNKPLIQFDSYNYDMVDVYLQEYNNAWTSISNYKEISIWNDDLIDYALLHHIDSLHDVFPQSICLNGNKDLFDYEFIDKFVQVNFLHDGSFDNTLDMTKRDFTIDDISDEILASGYETHFTWCPKQNHFVNPSSECHNCLYLIENEGRCNFRFRDILKKGFKKIINIEYSNIGKVEYVTVSKNKKRYRIKYDKLPENIFTIKEAFEDKKNTNIMIVKNIKTGWKVMISKYDYMLLMKTNQCYGKVQGPNSWSTSYSKKKHKIFGFYDKQWELIWRK